jgi:hypothetical protein
MGQIGDGGRFATAGARHVFVQDPDVVREGAKLAADIDPVAGEAQGSQFIDRFEKR